MGWIGDAADTVSNFFTSSPDAASSEQAGITLEPKPQGGLPAAPGPGAAIPVATTPNLASQAAQIQAAIAKLSALQPVNDPMMYFQAAAGLGAPTKSGSFFESLASGNKGVGEDRKSVV